MHAYACVCMVCAGVGRSMDKKARLMRQHQEAPRENPQPHGTPGFRLPAVGRDRLGEGTPRADSRGPASPSLSFSGR